MRKHLKKRILIPLWVVILSLLEKIIRTNPIKVHMEREKQSLMKKRILLTGLFFIFVSSAANAQPAFNFFQNVYSEHREYSADFGGGSWWMMIATTFATENTYPVYLEDFPTGGSDLQLPYLPGWSVPNTTFGHCYSEAFSHTGMGGTYDPPDNSSWVRDYYFYIDVDSSGDFSLGDIRSSVRTISDGDIQQLDIPQNVNISGTTNPTVTWDPVSGASKYRVLVFPVPGGSPDSSNPLFISGTSDATSFNNFGNTFDASGNYAIAVEARQYLDYQADPANYINRSRYYAKHCVPLPTADIIFINGQVITMETDMPQAEALATKGEYILAVGTDDEILNLSGPGTQIIDLDGKALLPGFVDAHTHLFNDAGSMGLTLEEAQQIGLERGITALANMCVPPNFLQEMKVFEQQGLLRIRTTLYLLYNTNCGVVLGDWYKQHPPSRDPSLMLRVNGIKIMSDGGSCLRPAFSLDLPDWAVRGGPQGDLFLSAKELTDIVSDAQAGGYQVAIHAMGDLAVETVLNGIEDALDGQPNTYRHRIEHNYNIRPELLARYGQIGIVAVVWRPFTYWLMNPFFYMRGFIDMHGEIVQPWFSPWRSLLNANPGLHVAWHSDHPWVGDTPLADLYGLVTRKELANDGMTVCRPPVWVAGEGISVGKALRLMTIEAAYSLFMEDMIGSLKPDKFADLIVLSDNPLTVHPDSLMELKVLLTMVGGCVEYSVPGLEVNNVGGSISGHVYQSDMSTPIEGAEVFAFDSGLIGFSRWVVRGKAETDSGGNYAITGVPTGKYAVWARAAEDGYAGEWYQNTYYFDSLTPVSVTAPGDNAAINFSLDAGGTISGQVIYLDNSTPVPIANVSVSARDSQTQMWMASSRTDTDGYYTLGLPAGSYIVRASAPSACLNYYPEYYDGVYNINDAAPITVTVGQDTPSINLTLEAGIPLKYLSNSNIHSLLLLLLDN